MNKAKKLTFVGIAVMLLSVNAAAQRGEHFSANLWPEGAPVVSNDPNATKEKGGVIHVFPADTACNTRRAVILCPGGGYARLSMENEGYAWVPFFREQGFTTIILQYRMPYGNPAIPKSDLEQAMRKARLHASEWGFNAHEVGVMGFSAGGHLASTLTVTADSLLRPAFSVLFYPVISMSEEFAHKRSHDCLLTDGASAEVNALFSSEQHVTEQTPPTFIALSNDDRTVHPRNGVSFYLAMLRANRPASLHVYPTGRHGWGFRDTFPYHHQVTEELKVWLQHQKQNKKQLKDH